MDVVYLSTDSDTTTELAVYLEVKGYECRIIEMNGKGVSDSKNICFSSDIC